MHRRFAAVMLAVVAMLAALVTGAPGATAAAPGRMLFAGQSNEAAWNDLAGATGVTPNGGSVYYSVRDGAFEGASGAGSQNTYLAFLGQRGASIEVGVSWKDDPPAWDGNPADQATASQQATAAIAAGSYDAQFNALIQAIKTYPNSTFYVRVDYEVSTAYQCMNGTDCSVYVNAFHHLASLIRGQSGAGSRVKFVYHPVRGEFDTLYPGDDVVDWIGVSVFNQDLCQPYWDSGTTYWNGQENTSDRTCLGYYDDYVNGNLNAISHEYPVDLNILRMMWFAQQHGKPMMVAESGVQRMSGTLNADGTQADSDYAAYASRLGSLIGYRGPLPNGVINGQQTNFIGTNYDLSNVIQSVTSIGIDWRYGFDGQTSPTESFQVANTSGWFVNSLISRYQQGESAFCTTIAQNGFATQCRTTGSPLIGQGSSRCLDIQKNGTADGTPVQLWDCSGNGNQQWRLTAGAMVNPASGKCLDVAGGGTANGTQVRLWTCNGLGAQQWVPQANGNLVNPESGRCLDVDGWGTANGSLVELWDCGSAQSNQIWTV
jgi:hypothetical protein